MVVITNDDGINAPGIRALSQAAEILPMRRIIVAPKEAMSECSHRVTTKCPLHVDRIAEDRWSVDGTPADCVRVALLHLAEELGEKIDLVVSGINCGGNLGADVYISGTVAAAREAAFFGLPAIALSQYRRTRTEPDWSRSTQWARRVLPMLLARPCEEGTLWNVNFPEPHDPQAEPDVVDCPKSTRPLPVKYEHGEAGLQYVWGRYSLREYEHGSDIDVCFNGRISVSLIRP